MKYVKDFPLIFSSFLLPKLLKFGAKSTMITLFCYSLNAVADEISSETHFRTRLYKPMFFVDEVSELYPELGYIWDVNRPDEFDIAFSVNASEINRRMSQHYESKFNQEPPIQYEFIKVGRRGSVPVSELDPILFLSKLNEGVWPIGYSESDGNIVVSDDPRFQRFYIDYIRTDAVLYDFALQAFLTPIIHPDIFKRLKTFSRVSLHLIKVVENEPEEVKNLARDLALYVATHIKVSIAYLRDIDFSFTNNEIDRNRWGRKLNDLVFDDPSHFEPFSINNDLSDARLIAEVGNISGFFLGGSFRTPPSLIKPLTVQEFYIKMFDRFGNITSPGMLISRFLQIVEKESFVVSPAVLVGLNKEIFTVNNGLPNIPGLDSLERFAKKALGANLSIENQCKVILTTGKIKPPNKQAEIISLFGNH